MSSGSLITPWYQDGEYLFKVIILLVLFIVILAAVAVYCWLIRLPDENFPDIPDMTSGPQHIVYPNGFIAETQTPEQNKKYNDVVVLM